MANALNNLQTSPPVQGFVLNQALHGYSEGHRLLDSSIAIPEDLRRVMLRMSDRSGSSVISGFQDYLTGYPLRSMDAYAIAKTWYAPEMSRPGCVWTHTLIVPVDAMSRMTNLSEVVSLFKRPSGRSVGESYSKPLMLTSEPSPRGYEKNSQHQAKLQELLAVHYAQGEFHPIIVPAAGSDEYEDLIFAIWSQKWPALRVSFTFCTGSISARTFENRPLDIQCVPIVTSRQVCYEIEESGFTNPSLLESVLPDLPRWTNLAADDALQYKGGPIRSFLWSVSDAESLRDDFAPFMRLYDAILVHLPFPDLMDLTANLFPGPNDGRRLKRVVFGDQPPLPVSDVKAQDLLLEFATTDNYKSFDPDDLKLKSRAGSLLVQQPNIGYWLLEDLFRASLNPTGDEILRALILAMSPKDAVTFAGTRQQFVPSLFRANPTLASAPELWRIAKGRKWELFESLASLPRIEPETIRGIVMALLDSSSDSLLERAFQEWGLVALRSALDWVDAHDGTMMGGCRSALTSRFQGVVDWLATKPQISSNTLASVAHIVAPHVREIANADSTAWLRALKALRQENREDDETYLSALVLALALCNAPPKPLDLVSVSFERVHWLAAKDRLPEDAWLILQPLVPELSWWNSWDKCERMRRALMSSFAKYSWPAWELRERIVDQNVVKQLLESAKKVNVDHYFRGV